MPVLVLLDYVLLAMTPGDRFPWKALGIGLLMLGTYLINVSTPAVPAAEVLRDPSPPAPWTTPSVDDLLSGKACIPLARLLENRPLQPVHSYRVEVACPMGDTR